MWPTDKSDLGPSQVHVSGPLSETMKAGDTGDSCLEDGSQEQAHTGSVISFPLRGADKPDDDRTRC